MLQAIKSNPKTSVYGILALVAFALKENPSLVDFIPETPRNYILGISALICAALAFLNTQDKLTPAEQEVKLLKKEVEREGLKQEIKEEVKVIAAEKAAELIQVSITPPKAVVVPEITADILTVNEIHAESVVDNSTNTEKI